MKSQSLLAASLILATLLGQRVAWSSPATIDAVKNLRCLEVLSDPSSAVAGVQYIRGFVAARGFLLDKCQVELDADPDVVLGQLMYYCKTHPGQDMFNASAWAIGLRMPGEPSAPVAFPCRPR